MDPTQTLNEIRQLYNKLKANGYYLCDNHPEIVGELIDRVVALDEWLSKGGFLPTQWEDEVR